MRVKTRKGVEIEGIDIFIHPTSERCKQISIDSCIHKLSTPLPTSLHYVCQLSLSDSVYSSRKGQKTFFSTPTRIINSHFSSLLEVSLLTW